MKQRQLDALYANGFDLSYKRRRLIMQITLKRSKGVWIVGGKYEAPTLELAIGIIRCLVLMP